MTDSKYIEAKRIIEEKGYKLITVNFDSKWRKWSRIDVKCPKNHDMSTSLETIIRGAKCRECKRLHTYDAIVKEFSCIGYKLLSSEYVNTSTLLDYECNKGHQEGMTYLKFKRGGRCNKCNPKKRPTYESVKSAFEEIGYTMISTKYVKSIDKLDIICDKGHSIKLSYNKFTTGRRCVKCSGSYQMTYDEIKEFYKNRNYVLLSPESDYKTYQSTLKFRCDQGHVNDMKFMSIRNGYKCSICTGNKKLTYEFVKKEFEKRGYILITKKYTNARTQMKFRCNNGNHNHQMTYDDIKQGSKCGKCSGSMKLEYDVVSKAFEDVGYTLLSKIYKNSHQKLKIKCNEGHISTITYTHFKSSGRRCSLCSQSNGERAIQEYLDACSLVIDYVPQKSFDNCQTVHRKRYDFEVLFATGTRFLIEYDGRQHFTPIEFFGGQKSLKSTRRRDLLKTNYCRKRKIPLLRISYRHIGKIPEIIENFMIKVSINPHVIHFTDEDLYEHLMI